MLMLSIRVRCVVSAYRTQLPRRTGMQRIAPTRVSPHSITGVNDGFVPFKHVPSLIECSVWTCRRLGQIGANRRCLSDYHVVVRRSLDHICTGRDRRFWKAVVPCRIVPVVARIPITLVICGLVPFIFRSKRPYRPVVPLDFPACTAVVPIERVGPVYLHCRCTH